MKLLPRKKKKLWKYNPQCGCENSHILSSDMIDKNRLPAHIAIIMDGNGRWAKKRNLPRVMGHNAGMKSMIEVVRRASDLGVEYLTVYAFSTENWKRSVEEVSGIFRLLVKFVKSELKELKDNNVKLNIIGDYQKIPEDAKRSVEEAVNETKDNTGLKFNIALNYGSRDEMMFSVRRIAGMVKSGEVEPEDIDDKLFAENLYTGMLGLPDPDLIIRTSGEKRLSNFLMWQAAYSEFVFSDVLWPDFSPEEFERCIEEYCQRDRRFGGRK